ncbi:MAG TPA: pilus assembly protein MshP [Gammaproteobacteria bacterium]|nr:pilus assembly protein MshP [Gammaproteobacteria bacterium]
MNKNLDSAGREPSIWKSPKVFNRGRYELGFSLVGTVFIITVLAALAAFLVTISGTEQAAATYSLQGARAYAAALSGIEWAARQALPPGGGGSCAASTTITSASGAPNNFTITVTCTSTSVTEGANTYNVYNLTSTATTGSTASADLISRTIQASITNG